MKTVCVGILVTSAIGVLILNIVYMVLGREYILVQQSILGIFLANILIWLGLFITRKFESKYFILELGLDIAYTAVVVLAFGARLGWIYRTGAPLLIAMVVVIHLAVLALDVTRARKDDDKINKLIQKRKGQ